MRPPKRHLLLYIGLLLPLAALAWVGSSEIRRQSDRLDKAFADHALTFLRDTSNQLEQDLIALTDSVRDDIILGIDSLVRVDAQVVAGDPLAQHLLVLDGEGSLIYPDPSPRNATSLPYSGAPSAPEVTTAEQLIALEDLEGARETLESFLTADPRPGPGPGSRGRRSRGGSMRQRAEFRLAGVMRWLGDHEAAAEHYREAIRLASSGGSFRLLAATGLAETTLALERDHVDVLDLMQRIADGDYYREVADPLAAETMLYLADLVPEGTPEHERALRLLDADRLRRRGRQFGDDYRRYLSATVRRQLRSNAEDVHYVCFVGDQETSLLALRQIRDDERSESLLGLDGVAWIGIHYDLTALLDKVLDRLLAPSSDEFYLAIESPDGEPILPRDGPLADTDSDLDALLPRFSTIANMSLRAIVADPQRFLADRRRAARNRTILVLALCLAAGAGAFLLVRSAARESEIADVKMQLLSRISHELKTPVALIKMYGETLEQGRVSSPEQVTHFSGIISREADRLTAMIQRVLDFSRRESGEEPAPRVDADLGDLATAVTDAYRPRAATRGVELLASIAPGIRSTVDRSAFESALQNLIENAVKYSHSPPGAASPAEPLRVEVRLAREGRGHAVLTVADRGIGIPENERSAVFSSFYRARNAGEAPGAGLGLSLVKGFAEDHGGCVQAQARPGGGTIMTIRIPCDAKGSPDASPTGTESRP